MRGADGCQRQPIPPGAEGTGGGEPPNAGAGSRMILSYSSACFYQPVQGELETRWVLTH